MTSTTARQRGRGPTLLAVVVVALGIGLVLWGLASQRSEPAAPTSTGKIDPSVSASAPVEADTTDGARPEGSAKRANRRQNRNPGSAVSPTPLPLSQPERLQIPSLDIDTPVNPIGKNADGTLAVPQPGPRLDQAAWFDQSPSPGQPGPAIVEGHVDSDQGPSVFYELAKVRPGDDVIITRQDGITVTFTVDALRDVDKARFPTELVYGAKDLSTPRLRLITCSQFDPDIGSHVGNTVVFATLSDLEQG